MSGSGPVGRRFGTEQAVHLLAGTAGQQLLENEIMLREKRGQLRDAQPRKVARSDIGRFPCRRVYRFDVVSCTEVGEVIAQATDVIVRPKGVEQSRGAEQQGFDPRQRMSFPKHHRISSTPGRAPYRCPDWRGRRCSGTAACRRSGSSSAPKYGRFLRLHRICAGAGRTPARSAGLRGAADRAS